MTWQNYERIQRRQARDYPGPGGGTADDPWTPGIDPSLGPNAYTGATLRSVDQYFDPQATSDSWPDVTGLQMKALHWSQGDEFWDTYEEIGPTDQSITGQNPDPTASVAGDAPPGGTPGPVSPTGVSDVGGVPLQWCEEDGIIGDLIGAQDNTIQIVLQGVQDVGDFYFPVNPEELTASFDADNDYEVDAIGIGELIIPGAQRLESIGWSSFFPINYDDGYVSIPSGLMLDPNYAMQKLIETKRERLVCFLTIGGTPWNDYVLIKTLKWTSKAGEPGDIYYDIEFKRYRETSIQTLPVPFAGVEDPRDNPANQGPNTDTGQKPPPTQDNPNGSDQSNGNEVPVNTAPTDTASTPPLTPSEGLARVGSGLDKQIVQSTYTTQRFMSLQEVYEDIKRQGNGEYNTLDKLRSDNANQPVGWILNPTKGSAADILGSRKNTVGDYADSEQLPIGTILKCYVKTKIEPPPYVPPKTPGSLVDIIEKSTGMSLQDLTNRAAMNPS